MTPETIVFYHQVTTRLDKNVPLQAQSQSELRLYLSLLRRAILAL